jgi:signal transduction histidine kinase
VNPFALSGLLTGITSLAFGYFVYLKGRTRQLNKLWFVFTASVAVWGFGGMWIALADTETEALWAWRIAFACGVLWIPILFYHFVCTFCELSRRKSLLFFYSLGMLLFPLIFTDLFFSGVRFTFSSFYYSLPGPFLFPFFFLWWLGMVVYSHYELLRVYRHTSGQKKNQIKYFFLATAVGYSGGSLDYLPIFGVDLYPYGNFTIILYPIIMTYAIVRYRLMDITVVINRGLAYGLLLGIIFLPIYLAALISQRVALYSILPLSAGTLIFACGLWVLLKNPRAAPHITFSLVSLAVTGWLFGSFMMYSASRETEALFWSRFIYAGVVYIPAFFYHFCASFLQQTLKNKLILTNYLISTAFLLLIPSSYLIENPHSYFWGYYSKAGVLHPVFLTYFALVSGLSLLKLYLGYKAKSATQPLEAKRIKYVFWAFVIGFTASIDFIQNYGYEFYPLGYLSVTFWAMIVAYAILKYQLLDITVILNRAKFAPYAQAMALIPFYVAVLVLIRAFTGSMQYMLAGILVAMFTILAGLLMNLQRGFEKAVGKVLFREKYDAYKTLTDFSKAMVTILDLRALNEKIITTLSEVMGIMKVSLFMLDEEKDSYFLTASHGMDEEHIRQMKIKESDPLPRYLVETDRLVMREELQHNLANTSVKEFKEVVSALVQIESEICIPLINKDRLIGFLNLGQKKDRGMYSQEDLDLLSTLGQNAAIALDNALLYEDLQRQKSLMRRTDRLRSLETVAGGFAHEIRNPLTSIKTFIELAPARKDDPEFIGPFSKVVSEDVHRIERLIQEILDYARYMQPRLTEEDINEVVESSLYFIGVKASGRNILIEKELTDDLSRTWIDRQQIKQVLLNLFLNAMDAMSDGGRLVIRTHRLTKEDGEPWVQIEVGDTGCGISREDLDHIFDPFFTTKHESKEREGTGLGLSIVHQIVQEHRGYIEVESTIGAGTTFYVNLPTNPLLHDRRKQKTGVS